MYNQNLCGYRLYLFCTLGHWERCERPVKKFARLRRANFFCPSPPLPAHLHQNALRDKSAPVRQIIDHISHIPGNAIFRVDTLQNNINSKSAAERLFRACQKVRARRAAGQRLECAFNFVHFAHRRHKSNTTLSYRTRRTCLFCCSARSGKFFCLLRFPLRNARTKSIASFKHPPDLRPAPEKV